jgi:hypothetical protein
MRSFTTAAIIKDRHARIIIVRAEITLHLEAGYIFAGCSRRNRFFLQFGGGPYIFQQPIHQNQRPPGPSLTRRQTFG